MVLVNKTFDEAASPQSAKKKRRKPVKTLHTHKNP